MTFEEDEGDPPNELPIPSQEGETNGSQKSKDALED